MTTMSGAEGLPEQVSMILLGVEQLERSVVFYRDLVGLPFQGQGGGICEIRHRRGDAAAERRPGASGEADRGCDRGGVCRGQCGAEFRIVAGTRLPIPQ